MLFFNIQKVINIMLIIYKAFEILIKSQTNKIIEYIQNIVLFNK